MRLLQLGFTCNNACVFCAQGALRDAESAPPDPTAAIAAIAPGETVAFVGGEPTLHDALPDWIRAAHARGPARIIVQTNGRRLAYRTFAHALAEASPRLFLDVSLQGATAAMHDWHTGTPGSFEQTVNGLRAARAERISAGVTTVVTRSNFRHLAEIARVAHAAGARAIHFAPVEPSGRAAAVRDQLLPAAAMVVPYLTRASAEAQRLGLGVVAGERASAPTFEGLFPGIGEVEPAPAPPERKVALRILGAPGGDPSSH